MSATTDEPSDFAAQADTPPAGSPAPGRLRPRFSLLTALLLMTVVGMATVIVLLWREVGPLREEVRRLRDEMGVLVVDDPTKVNAIQVNTRDDLTWKWRVWIPKGGTYVIRSFGDDIPKEGFPQQGGTMPIHEPGEYVIGYEIDRDRANGGWYGKTTLAGTGSVGKDHQPWVEWTSKTSTGGGVPETAQTYEPGERIELMRHRVSQVRDSTKIEDPSAGFMIWLEPVK
jgi:hypothetical protein